MQKSQKYLVKIVKKSNFHRNFYHNSEILLKDFKSFLHFLVQTRKVLPEDFLFFLACWKLFLKF